MIAINDGKTDFVKLLLKFLEREKININHRDV